jgi:DNA/RNA endonuclease YhcR with UshA esterase domain
VTLCDTVYDYKVVNDTLKLLNIGGRYPNQLLTVAVKGKKIVLKPETLKGKKVCFQGQVTLFKNKPELVATEPEQVVVN